MILPIVEQNHYIHRNPWAIIVVDAVFAHVVNISELYVFECLFHSLGGVESRKVVLMCSHISSTSSVDTVDYTW
jgi:hypothetical protein